MSTTKMMAAIYITAHITLIFVKSNFPYQFKMNCNKNYSTPNIFCLDKGVLGLNKLGNYEKARD